MLCHFFVEMAVTNPEFKKQTKNKVMVHGMLRQQFNESSGGFVQMALSLFPALLTIVASSHIYSLEH